MTSKFSRFLHLERSRAGRPSPEEPSQLRNGQRFEAVAGPREAPQAASVPEAHLERFRGDAPLSLVDSAQKPEHFPRCARCEADNSGFAKQCAECGADLTTPQQREYNERLQQSRQQAIAQEREAALAMEQAWQQREAEKLEDASRYAQLLKQAREQEQAGSWWRALHHHPSLGLGLLRLIPHPAIRWAVLAGAILVPLLLWRFGQGLTRFLGMFLGLIVVMLLVPRVRR
jgi:hypothetical protein